MFDFLQNLFSGFSWFSCLFSFAILILLLGYFAVPSFIALAIVVFFLWLVGLPLWLVILLAIPFLIVSLPVVRARILTQPIMKLLTSMKIMPEISETEKIAIEAGTTWVEGELFSGKPNFGKIFNEPYGKVASHEKDFIETQCRTVCEMVDDWQLYKDKDFSTKVWDYLKKEKFFGLIIPPEYGGLGFSALAHSEIVSYLSSRSVPLGITVMVPNSLGPAELLLHYGTKEQKEKYLPRLACGDEIPCFGLTESGAGSDAGSMISEAIVFRGEDQQLYLRMNWKKRYITLGAISTLLGIAIKVKDPDNLLGKGKFPGITCVLVPSTTKGVILGKRHDPMGIPFYNCPIEGVDVVVSVDHIIGGPEGAGEGWRMLMESLAAGRSISLPAQATAMSKFATRVASAYAEVRQQFGMPIGRFEGIEEALASMGASSYMLEASRIFTSGAVDQGLKPAVVSAIAKLRATEECRHVVTHGMDILGGAAISRGPKNLLAGLWWAAPIGITVEGANILTRTMIIFGQGAIRCHPYAYKELVYLAEKNVSGFDRAFWGHIGHVFRNACRAKVLFFTRGRLTITPGGPLKRYYQKLAWASASFAILSDLAMGVFGGTLKFREKITGRFADILSSMYLVTAILRRFEEEGQRVDHEAFAIYALEENFANIQKAFVGLFNNFDIPILGRLLSIAGFCFRFNAFSFGVSDKIGKKISQALAEVGETRDSITSHAIFIPKDETQSLATLELAFSTIQQNKNIYRKIRKAMKQGTLKKGKLVKAIDEALSKQVITEEEATLLSNEEKLRHAVTEVDAYAVDDFARGGNHPV
ncbi:MAG: acyl-CoA dehydrogenase [Bdellovibrionota bacterium]